MILQQSQFFESGNARFFDDVEFVGGDTVRDFVIEKEYVIVPQVLLALIKIPFLTLFKT